MYKENLSKGSYETKRLFRSWWKRDIEAICNGFELKRSYTNIIDDKPSDSWAGILQSVEKEYWVFFFLYSVVRTNRTRKLVCVNYWYTVVSTRKTFWNNWVLTLCHARSDVSQFPCFFFVYFLESKGGFFFDSIPEYIFYIDIVPKLQKGILCK